MRSRVVGRRDHLDRVGHLQGSDEGHRSAPGVPRRRCGGRRHRARFPLHLRRLVRLRREDWYSTSHGWMIRRSGCVCRVRLLGRARRIGAIIIVRRVRPLRGRLMRRTAHHYASCPRWSRIAAGRIILPHVNTTLRRARQFAYVVDRVIGSRVRMIGALSHELALGQETPLWTVASNDGPGNTDCGAVTLLYIVVGRRLVHADEIRPTDLRRCARV